MRVVLNIFNTSETRQVVMESSRFVIGRSVSADLQLEDEGVSSTHACIYCDGDRVWILDEGSANGTMVDGTLVPDVGVVLRDGSEISLGNESTIVIGLQSEQSAPGLIIRQERGVDQSIPGSRSEAVPAQHSIPIPFVVGSLGALLVLAVVVVVASFAFNNRDRAKVDKRQPAVDISPTPTVSDTPTPDAVTTPSAEVADNTPSPATNSSLPPRTTKLYLQMTPDEQMEFIDQQARHISLMMGNRPYSFNDDVLRYIKQYVDGYAKRVGNNSTKLWAEDMRSMFARAREQYVPHIIRAFNARGVPPVVGIYLVVVETEYHNIRSENSAGAAGLFQFIGPTARGYGVDPSERTNVAKMAPAAAAYMADRIAEFGPDSMSVALGIAGYNRSPDSVRRDLRDVLNSENRERSFWTLVANSSKLDHYFQGENIKYVPKFFAAAIVGETPWAFGIQMHPLSTYTEIKTPPETDDTK